MKAKPVILIFFYTVMSACLFYVISAYPTIKDQSNSYKEKAFDLYDLSPVIDSDLYNENKLNSFRNNFNSNNNLASSSSSEFNPAYDNVRLKRGRQCLWKICSWSREKAKKKSNYPNFFISNKKK